jgi:LmbE family N-acetylglucosaminyl deacetylase
MLGRTLVVAPHPDDEILGCGGTLLRRKAEGGALGWLIVSGMTETAGWSIDRIRARDAEIASVASLIGFDQVFNLRLPASRLDEIPVADQVAAFSAVFKSFAPEEVLVPHRGDVHSDHRITFDAVAACAKWFRYPSVRRVLAYETVSETEFGLSADTMFRPNFFVDIGQYVERKLEIMSVYQSELGEFPFPRSIRAIRALAEWRGSCAGYMAAEAFELLRERQ